jgi:hypothetical protein
MTQDKYYELMSQLGKDPVEAEIPPAWEDFPYIAQLAIVVYNKLGDRVAADIGFLGKDYTLLSTLLDVYQVNDLSDKELLLEIVCWIEEHNIKRSKELMDKEREKLKNKSRKK